MTPDTQVSFAFIFSVIAAVGVMYNILTSSKKSNKEEMSALIKANLKLDELCTTTRETRLDIRALETKIDQLKEKQIEHEQRLSNVEKKVEDL